MEIVEINTRSVTRCPTASDGTGTLDADSSCYALLWKDSGKRLVDGDSRRGIAVAAKASGLRVIGT